MVGWLFGLLVGWLVGWLVGLSVGWLVGRLVGLVVWLGAPSSPLAPQQLPFTSSVGSAEAMIFCWRSRGKAARGNAGEIAAELPRSAVPSHLRAAR